MIKKQLEFHPDVALDVKASFDWYEDKLAGLGDRFLDELENGYVTIQNLPEGWANFLYGFKRYILNRFPFSIIYKATDEKIFIIAVMHNSRRPNYWIKRVLVAP